MLKFSKSLEIDAKRTNRFLKSFLSKQEKKSHLLLPMKHGLFSGGKRFRSAIIFNTGKIYGIENKKLVAISAAVECIHSYSLIHDDLPSMDNDDLRRGKPSVHKKYGESSAILAGNSLLTLGFEILSSKDLKLPQMAKIQLINALSSCSGHSGIAGGQFSDLSFENKKVSKNDIIKMQNKKTGKLFGFCCESAAIINQENINQRQKLRNIGLNIGLLFQIADDLIDYKGDSKTVGKPTKKDKKKGKATLVNLIGYNETLFFAKKLQIKIEKEVKKIGNNTKHLLKSINFILERKY